jgi:molybdopterin-guanine dinucleotide biosynthesis protein A
MVAPPPAPRRDIVGVVLAGGASRRMGLDKRFALLAGRPLIAHVVARLAPQVEAVALALDGDTADRLANPPARAALFGAADRAALPQGFDPAAITLLPDPEGDRQGPLAGLLSGLAWAAGRGAARLVTTPVDTPFLPPDLVARLAAAAGAHEIAVAHSAGHSHPATALIPTALAEDLAAFLAAGADRKVGRWLARHAVREVDFPLLRAGGYDVDPLQNLNTPADLAAAETVFVSLSRPP